MIRRGLLLTAALALWAAPAASQSGLVVRRTSRNELGFRFTHTGFDGQSGGAIRRAYREWLVIGIEGTLVDPSVVDFRTTLRPTLGQVLQNRSDLPDASQNSLGFATGVRLFPRGLVSASFSASRTSATDRTNLGTETQSEMATLGAALALRNRLLPAEVRYQRLSRQQVWLDGGPQQLIDDNATERIRFAAKNRKTSILLERNLTGNRFSQRIFTTDRAEGRHTTRWGKGSRSQSTLTYVRGTRSSPTEVPGAIAASVERFVWTEALHLQHTRMVASDYAYRRGWASSGGIRTGHHDVGAALRAQVLPRLSAGVAIGSRTNDFQKGSLSSLTFSPDMAFGARLPYGGGVSGSASIGFVHNRSTPGDNGTVAIVDERHVVDASGRFTLENPLVDQTSVTVASSDRTRVFEAGVDYWFVEIAPFLDVVIPPGGRIATGDTLLVDYQYQAFPESSTLGVLASYGATVAFPVARVYYRRSLQAAGDGKSTVAMDGTSGIASLNDRDEHVVGLGVGGSTPVGRFDLLAERHDVQFGAAYSFTTYDIHGTLRVALPGNAHGAVGASASRTSGNTGRVDKLTSVTSSASWRPVPSLRLNGTFILWRWVQDGLRSKTAGGTLDAEWRVGMTRFVLQYSRNSWINVARRSGTNRLSTYFVRTF